MAIVRSHIPYYLDVLSLDGFLADPVLVFGVQDCAYETPPDIQRTIRQRVRLLLQQLPKKRLGGLKRRKLRQVPWAFRASDLGEILGNYGAREVRTLDLFDSRADLRLDMNDPLPEELRGGFNTVIDIGSIEHVFDTRQCLSNLFDLVRVEGHLFVVTPCNGYFDHGFHTLSPQCLTQAVEINGFERRHTAFTTPDGVELDHPNSVCDALIWLVARKVSQPQRFRSPQQGRWQAAYRVTS